MSSNNKIFDALLKVFSNKKLFRRNIEDVDIRVYFSTKTSDSKDFFAIYNNFSSEYNNYVLKRGTYAYHLSPPGKYSIYTYSRTNNKTIFSNVFHWDNYTYYPMYSSERIINDTVGSIIPEFEIMGIEYDGFNFIYSIKVQKEGNGVESDYLFPTELGLFIPLGVHTLEEVKEYNQNESFQDYQKESDDKYAFLKKQVSEHPYKESRSALGFIFLVPFLDIIAIFGTLHYRYWRTYSSGKNLEEILGDVKSNDFELDKNPAGYEMDNMN